MKPIVILTLDFPPTFIGGISAWSSDLADALHAAGHHVTVVAKSVGDTQKHDESKPYAIVRARGRSWAKWQSVWMWWAAKDLIDEDTLVIAATWTLMPRLLPRIKKRGAVLCSAFHGSEITTLVRPPSSLLAVVMASHHLFPVSTFLGRELQRLGCISESDPRLTVLPMPLRVDRHSERTPGDHLICVARPTERKGIDRAVGIAKVTGRHIHLIGPENGPEGTTAHGLVCRERVLQMMQGAAAVILTPQTNGLGLGAEGLGLVLLEAASMGVPAIGCDVGGVAEAIGPGLILGDPDDPNGDQINQWLVDGEKGKAAKEWVEQNHGPALCVSTIERVVR